MRFAQVEGILAVSVQLPDMKSRVMGKKARSKDFKFKKLEQIRGEDRRRAGEVYLPADPEALPDTFRMRQVRPLRCRSLSRIAIALRRSFVFLVTLLQVYC